LAEADAQLAVERDDSALDELRPLVVALKVHHAALAPELGPVRSDDDCWEHTRAGYARALAQEDGALFVARHRDSDELVGFAFALAASELGDWDRTAVEIEDIVVDENARGLGVGRRLLAAVREHAAGRDVRLGVLEANTAALRFYEREGFVPFVRQLLLPGELDG
jgi:ribosomal protein S18 acetylase RimI-like enzyme